MSWLFKSLRASDDDISAESQLNSSLSSSDCVHFAAADPSVKGDFSALGKTLSRQLRGFANFLAPLPSPAVVASADTSVSSLNSSSPSQTLQGIRNDLAEIGGGLRNGFSMLSVNSNKAVGGISRFASKLLPFQSHSTDDEEDEEFEDEFIDDTPGISDEILNFVCDISSRPEYWTEFPLALDGTDFKMSDVQRIHISTVEQLVPDISALNIKLQSFMSNELFWMIYFILLLPRFNQHDFELLATPEVVEARNVLLNKLQRKKESQVNSEDTCDNNLVGGTLKGNMPSEEKANSEITEGGEGLEFQDGVTEGGEGLEVQDGVTEGGEGLEVQDGVTEGGEGLEVQDGVTEGGEGLEVQDGDGDGNGENTNQRLEKADSKTSTDAQQRVGLEGISFSDIEDDGTDLSGRFSFTNPPRASSSTESSDWVQLHENLDSKLDQQKTWKQDRESEGGDSSDWFNVDDFD